MASYLQASLDASEIVEFETRLSFMAFAPHLILSAVLAICGLGLLADDGRFGIAVLVIALGIAAVVWLKVATTELAVTNKRLIAKTGIISRHTVEIMLVRIESVKVSQGIIGRMFDFGSIAVTGTGSTNESFHDIIDPIEFRRQLGQLLG